MADIVHYTQNELDQVEEQYQKNEGKRYLRQIGKTAKKLGVSRKFLESCQSWIQEDRAPTMEEFTQWARSQHKRACKEYESAWPFSHYQGSCAHMIRNKPCVPFFSHTGICETGYFVPERMNHLTWDIFNKQARKAMRMVRRELRS